LTEPPQIGPNGSDAETLTRRSGDESAKALPPSGTVPLGQRTCPLDSAPALAGNVFETIV
jgi:hypothetical protein